MLNRTSIEAALPIAEKLKERGLRILPKEDSPLMLLSMAGNHIGVAADLSENADLVSLVQQRSTEEAHQVAMADLISLATQSVSRVLDNARNVVLPQIRAVGEGVVDAVEARRILAVSPYEITMKEIPAVFSNTAILQMTARYPVNPALNRTWPAAREITLLTQDEVINLSKTGMEGVDSEMEQVLSLNNKEGYAQIADVLAGRKGVGDMNPDYAPGMMVVAQAVYDEPNATVRLSLTDYQSAINGILTAAVVLVKTHAASYEQVRQGGQLYVPTKTSVTEIPVYGPAYRKLLEAGLTPEALTGNEMTGRKYSSGQLIENKAQLEQVYTREMSLRALRTQNEMYSITRDCLDLALRTEIIKFEEVERPIYFERLRQEMAKLNEARCADVYQCVIDLVCGVFYPETDARTIICIINQVAADFGKDHDPREVALLASIKYVTRWVAGQLCLTTA